MKYPNARLFNFGTIQQEVHFGRALIAVTDAIKRLFEVTRALGRMPVHRIIEPAARQAREGF